ncbi:MAG TPA: DUF4331 family protein [Candidatus Limnocylindrales bacterium]
MVRPRRFLTSLAALGATATVLTVGAAPFLASASDHLDAPNLGAISVSASDQLSVSKANGPLDIADGYVFRGRDGNHTVLTMTVNPAVNLGIGPSTFQAGARYTFNVDRDGDAKPGVRYVVTFGKPVAARGGAQHYEVDRAVGDASSEVAEGWTGAVGRSDDSDVRAFAGLRSDPFFFDLLGFLGSVKGEGTRRLDDGKQSDFFAHLDVLGIVLEVPNSQIGGNGRHIGVWDTTSVRGSDGRWIQMDQFGRPAINTVFNATAADKEAFNATVPSAQRTALGGRFRTNVISTLEAFSALDTEGAYTPAQAAGLADVLLPDVMTYTVGSVAAGPLNGRNLSDDVIDAELNIVTGGYPFAGRNATGAIPTDGVGPHADYLASFPYLGLPH